MTDLAKLVVKMEAENGQLLRKLEQSDRRFKKMGRNTNKVFKGMVVSARTAAGLIAGALGGISLGQLVGVNRDMEQLRASLETVSGSSQEAAESFSDLKQFAAETPFSLREVTDSFIKMKALGLDPSEAALRSYGNTSAAMGKSLNQFIEAVADAATGEFERLKEFGIKASKQGERITFTFRGVKTEVGNNAGEIEQYLQKLGNVEFAGGMERQTRTLGGAISNLGDSWETFLDSVLSDESSGALSGFIRGLTDRFNDLAERINNTSVAQFNEQVDLLKGKIKSLDDEIDRPRLLRINPFASVQDLETQKQELIKALDDVIAKRDALLNPPPKRPQLLIDLENAAKATKDGALAKGLEELEKKAKKVQQALVDVEKEFNQRIIGLNAPTQKPDEDLSITDLDAGLRDAQASLRDGNFDDAVEKARQAFDIVDRMKSAGIESELILNHFGEKLRDVAVQAQTDKLADITAQLDVDEQGAVKNVLDANAKMQQALDQKPLIQKIAVISDASGRTLTLDGINAANDAPGINPGIIPPAAQQATQPQQQYQPVQINMPDGRVVPMYADPGVAEQFQRDLEREALRKGVRG